tara:strand:+ start:4100 stop:5386 length:1287 start_codon:yes stop_codon:yes gene_type:complete
MQNNQSNLSGFWAEDYLTNEKVNANNTSNLNLFIIWERSRDKSKVIIEDLTKKFVIRQIYEVQWSKEYFLTNLKRFYERRLPEVQEKANLCGIGPFLVVLVSDPKPILKKMITPTEEDVVNINMIENKMKYRKWVGEEYSIHSSISEKETNHDLTLLFNKNTKDLEKELSKNWDKSIKKIDQDIVGYDGWSNLKQLFYVFNGTVNYVILRNFEGMPDKFDFNDIDLLTEDEKIRYIIDGNFSLYGNNISRLKMNLGTDQVEFDFRYLKNQNYFDEKWLKNILKNRDFHPNGFYIPCKEDYFYTLLYHAIIHKKIISEKAKQRLDTLAKELNMQDVTDETFSNFEQSKKILNIYLRKMNYQNSNSMYYRLRHNQFIRLAKVSIFVAKTQGLKFLLGAITHKIQVSMSDSKNYVNKKGKVIDQTDYDLNN